jgi:rubrerythrin
VASGKQEHKMLFDLRSGRRRGMVKVVYGVLAVLMGASLFLTVGPVSIGEIFSNNSSSSTDAAEIYEEQAERIEAKLKKDPENPELLLALTRAEINAGNAGVTTEPNGARSVSTEALGSYQKADQTWTEYLKATDEPSPGLAQVVAPMYFQMAELSRSFPEVETRVQAAADAQKIVAEDRPNLNSLTTLALYTLFTGDFKAAEKARAEAKKFAGSESEKEAVDKQLDEYKKNAETFVKSAKAAAKAEKASGKPSETLANPLSGGLGGGGLGE